MTTTIFVIDDDEAVRDSLAALLSVSGFSVDTFGSALAFLEAQVDAEAGLIISDVRMPGLTGLELLERLKSRGSKMPVLLITGHGDVPLAVEAMRAGAADFIEKPFDHQTLVGSIERALGTSRASGPPASEAGTADPEQAAVMERLSRLTTRERQVLDGLVAGKPNKIVARDLDISPRTVEVYRANLMTKMNASSFSELVRMTIIAHLKA